MGKISKKLFQKFVDNKNLVLFRDGFISNGCWAIKKSLLNSVLNGSEYKVNNVITLTALMTQDFILGKIFSDKLLTRVDKEIRYYDNIKFKEHKSNGREYLLIDNINEFKNYGIDKLYYSIIQKIVGKLARIRIFRIDYVYYYRKWRWNGEIDEIAKDTFIFFVWIKSNIDDLNNLLAVCRPIKFD